jgi:hypothetical protein
MVFPIVAPPDPRGPWFVQTWINIISETFYVDEMAKIQKSDQSKKNQ